MGEVIVFFGLLVAAFICGFYVGHRYGYTYGYKVGVSDGKWNVIGVRSPWHR